MHTIEIQTPSCFLKQKAIGKRIGLIITQNWRKFEAVENVNKNLNQKKCIIIQNLIESMK